MRSATSVILVGSNPSRASVTADPFHHSTKSRRMIDAWFKEMNVDLHFTNVVDYCTPDNRPLKVSEIRDNLSELASRIHGYDRVVALGRTAEKALSMLNAEFIHVPHPSGLNRFWNDADRSRDMIEALRSYVDGRDG